MPNLLKTLLHEKDYTGICFDVGANIGEFSRNHFQNASEIHAFEPVPENFVQLEQAAAGIMSRGIKMYCNKLALFDYKGVAEHVRPYESWALLSEPPLHKNGVVGHGLVDRIPAFDMQMTTLDLYVEKNKIDKIDFIKVDVDGADLRVLKGAWKTLDRDRPHMYIELSWLLMLFKDSVDEMSRLIIEAGYRVFEVNGESAKNQEVVGYEALRKHPYWDLSGDLILVHQTRVGEIWL